MRPRRAGEVPASATVTIPRSYALIIGIAGYKNLAAKDQLLFAERDAESIYSILISPEGGNSAQRMSTALSVRGPRLPKCAGSLSSGSLRLRRLTTAC